MSLRQLRTSYLFLSALLLPLGCVSPPPDAAVEDAAVEDAAEASLAWPDGVAYEIFVHAFADADGDGLGDIPGMTQQLDYLADLGVRAVWLMPIHPSPSYHKYDVLDYRAIHPDYGTLDDFKRFVDEAHARDIAVIIDFVVNHSGRGHPWFQQAVADPDGPYRDYYVWATPEEVAEMGETKEVSADSDNRVVWHEAEGTDERYYGFFGGHMPDLNFDNPAVREEIIDAGRFWLEEVGVDGFRLDAAKHIFPDDRAPDNHAWWVEFKEAMQAVDPDVYLVGEVWAESDVVAPYLSGLTALFNFDLGYAITRAVQAEQADSLAYRLDEIRDFYTSVEPRFRDATFITNHDQNRIMSEVGGDENKARMAAALLLTLPGSPFVYYGEEIGMQGQKPDEQIREPFLWGGDDADLTTAWIEPVYSTPATVTPAAEQMADPGSLLNHYKALIALRNEHASLLRGDLEPVSVKNEGVENAAVVSFQRTLDGEALWVVHNLAGTAETIDVPEAAEAFADAVYASADAPARAEGRLTLPPYSTTVFAR